MDEWWRRRGSPLPLHAMPRTGFSVSDGSMLCGCFLYVMECKGGNVGMVAHTIVNPDRMLAGCRAVNAMMQDIRSYAEENSFVTLMCLTRSRLLAKAYLDNGFILAEAGTDMYIAI